MNIKTPFIICCLFASSYIFCQQSIFDAARSGTVEDIKHLMSINADTINSIEKSGYSPLVLACYSGNDDVAEFLAKNVYDINGDSDHGTPLMAAVYKNRDNLVEMLLNLNANPNKADPNGTTALHYAVIMRNEKIIDLLIKAKSDLSLKDNRNLTAKDYALMTKKKAIIELFN
ncbi:ankyrin repeat domain-containing protein [Pontimicrobium sp. SW4]|uniref:Ankyrin repeat domain-containing protein n=1 Tax=Pontimicrobium sp. SW4 TaxID=3153519 RepID=A0AAU7BVR5_9FLAO